MRISKSCRGDIQWWSTTMVLFNLTRKSEWHLGRWSTSQTDRSPDKWRKKMKSNTGKNSKSHAHSTATYCLLSTQQKIKAYHFTFISSFLSYSLLSTSLHLESFVFLFFHFSVSPFSGFCISVTLQPYPLRSPSFCLPFSFFALSLPFANPVSFSRLVSVWSSRFYPMVVVAKNQI